MHNKIAYSWLPVIGWCSLIFYLSSVPNLKTEFGAIDLILRKIAHVTEYCILFLLSRRACVNSFSGWNTGKSAFAAIVFSILYAAGDEYHQSFVPTRGPSVIDVGIDTVGVFAGFFVYMFWKNCKERSNGS